jgi:uncharacterized LabA/DUF88 family protein
MIPACGACTASIANAAAHKACGVVLFKGLYFMNKRRVTVYVDGFNLYHALRNLKDARLRWLDLRALAGNFIHPQHEEIIAVKYFSAIAFHIGDETATRHQLYIEALQSTGVEFVEGKFKKRKSRCPIELCNGREITRREEKETDVNVAIHIVRDAMLRKTDKQIIITNDTDILPAIRMSKQENQSILITVLTPPTYNPHVDLWKNAGQKRPTRIEKVHIENSLLPEILEVGQGHNIYMPTKYHR